MCPPAGFSPRAAPTQRRSKHQKYCQDCRLRPTTTSKQATICKQAVKYSSEHFWFTHFHFKSTFFTFPSPSSRFVRFTMSSGSKVHSTQSSALQDHPSAVLVPSLPISKHQKLSKNGSSLPPVTPVGDGADRQASEEKIGRWSEAEHNIFLEGLATHGKQWKTISTMIGTRTVVQVRTHAQKYFQKLERKNKNGQGGPANKPSIAHTKQSKRKSLPSSMPSRKKSKTLASKPVVSRTASLSHVNHFSLPQPHTEM